MEDQAGGLNPAVETSSGLQEPIRSDSADACSSVEGFAAGSEQQSESSDVNSQEKASAGTELPQEPVLQSEHQNDPDFPPAITSVSPNNIRSSRNRVNFKPPRQSITNSSQQDVAQQVIAGLTMLSPLSEPSSPEPSGARSPDQDTGWEQLLNGPRFTTRFSVEDITKNLNLVKAARKELDGNVHLSAPHDELAEMLEVWHHDADLQRQRLVLNGIDQDAQEESNINRELASVMVQRLKNSSKGVEALSKMLTEWGKVEQTAATALANVGEQKYVGPNDASSIRRTVRALQGLVNARAAAAAKAHQSLAGQQKLLTQMLADLRSAARQIHQEASTIQKKVEAARADLLAAFEQHSQVCMAFDSGFRFTPGSGMSQRAVKRALEHDPWITEEQLVQRHTELQKQQDSQRAFLKRSLGQVQQLETQRVSVLHTVVAGIAEQGSSLGPLSSALQQLQAAVHSAEDNPELLELAEVAGNATQSAEELAARQAESIAGVCQELFASPEIMRQGSMMYWHPITGQWKDCHFVMTRAGFLHWFTNLTDTRQRDALNLSRCELINGEAQVFNIVEAATPGMFGFVQSPPRKCTFKAHSVEEYCEWAIAIREAIVAVSGKHVQYLGGRN